MKLWSWCQVSIIPQIADQLLKGLGHEYGLGNVPRSLSFFKTQVSWPRIFCLLLLLLPLPGVLACWSGKKNSYYGGQGNNEEDYAGVPPTLELGKYIWWSSQEREKQKPCGGSSPCSEDEHWQDGWFNILPQPELCSSYVQELLNDSMIMYYLLLKII